MVADTMFVFEENARMKPNGVIYFPPFVLHDHAFRPPARAKDNGATNAEPARERKQPNTDG